MLRELGLPTAQQNERSGYTLLTLAGLEPEQRWRDVTNPQLGVRPIMDWMREAYGKSYAENSRETIRRFTLRQFMAAGLVVMDPNLRLPTNSPNHVYQLTPEVLPVLRSFGSGRWQGQLAAWHSEVGRLTERWAAERQHTMIPVSLPDGTVALLSGGGQNPLIKAIIEEFAPRFAPGGRVLYLGDAGDKFVIDKVGALAEVGVVIDKHDKMPDVVIYLPEQNWLMLVEAVTSHGPIGPLRKDDLAKLFAGSTARLVYITAFEDGAGWQRHFDDIAWETEVWLASAPSHMVHFNGGRFLGPH